MIDQFGADPLREPTLKLISDKWEPHTVKNTELANPHALAKRYYGTYVLFHVILSYNGLVHQCELYAGQVLKIPKLDITKKATAKVYEF